MIPFDLHRLQLLREFEERGTLGAVAAALSFSPSAVSQQLAVLEREVGLPLLEKAGRGVRLTDAGRLLAAHARTLLDAAEIAATELAALGGEVRGTVRAGGLQSVARRLLVPAIAELGSAHPGLRSEVTELELEQALPGLRLGAMDLVVSDEYEGHPRPRPSGLRFEPLLGERLFLVLRSEHPLAASGAPVALRALRDEVWVTSPAGTGHHAMVVGTCRSLGGFEPDVRHRVTDAELHFALVRATGAVALLPALTLPPDDPTLAVREVAGVALQRQLTAVTRDGPRTPALEELLTAVRRQVGRLGTPGLVADPRPVSLGQPASRSGPGRAKK